MTRVSKHSEGEDEDIGATAGGVSGLDKGGSCLVTETNPAEEGSSKYVGWTKFVDGNRSKGSDCYV